MADRTNNMGYFFTRKNIIIMTLILLAVIGCSVFIFFYKVKNQIKAMFKLNRQLQEQNYYMADFERKMLGIAYHIDKGHYIKGLSMLNRYHDRLKSKKGLIKIPEFAGKEEELDFYLNLQNPKTGAFMDDAYPLCTYHGNTEDALLHIVTLADETGRPFKLKYKLNYLDQLNTPAKVTAFLHDVSFVGSLAAIFPQTSFHFARDIFSLVRDEENYNANDVEMLTQKHNLYKFSPEWKRAVLKWFYEHQDPKTGLWGPKSKNGKLLKKDLNNTSSVMEAFVDKNGNDIHEAFPLRYQKELVASALEAINEPVPSSNDSLDDFHEWNLHTSKAMRMLTRYLWKGASPEDKNRARASIKKYIRVKCEQYYIPEEGAFSYYPNSKKAILDGALSFFTFKEIGALSAKKQEFLWGAPEENIDDAQLLLDPLQLTPGTLKSIAASHDINSFRFYRMPPSGNDLTSDVFAVVYPDETPVPDIMDLSQQMLKWIDATDQSLGNWTSRENIRLRLKSIDFPNVTVFKGSIPFDRYKEILRSNNELVVIGFDVLQIPCCKIVFKANQESLEVDESLFSTSNSHDEVSWSD